MAFKFDNKLLKGNALVSEMGFWNISGFTTTEFKYAIKGFSAVARSVVGKNRQLCRRVVSLKKIRTCRKKHFIRSDYLSCYILLVTLNVPVFFPETSWRSKILVNDFSVAV